MIKVLFVCLGNICRSPAAEGVMNKYIDIHNLSSYIQCDSAGTSSYHSGSKADSRMRNTAIKRGYDLLSISRQLQYDDLIHFDYIIAMDDSNFHNIRYLDPEGTFHHKVFRLCDFCSDTSTREVPDPYYGGDQGFERVLNILEDGCNGLLSRIREEEKL